jgi:hypothetical protein
MPTMQKENELYSFLILLSIKKCHEFFVSLIGILVTDFVVIPKNIGIAFLVGKLDAFGSEHKCSSFFFELIEKFDGIVVKTGTNIDGL